MQNMRKGIETRVKRNKLFNWLGGEQDGCDHREGTTRQRHPNKSKACAFRALFSITYNHDYHSNCNKTIHLP